MSDYRDVLPPGDRSELTGLKGLGTGDLSSVGGERRLDKFPLNAISAALQTCNQAVQASVNTDLRLSEPDVK